jgi:DNA-binding NarL/FixJ family response regulator
VGKTNIERAALAAALERISMPSFYVAPDGSVELANSAATALLERRHDALSLALAGNLPHAEITVIGDRSGSEVARLVVIRPSSPPPLLPSLPVATSMPCEPTRPSSLPNKSRASRDRPAARKWKLSRRQAEVLELVVRGESNKDIAWLLGIAESTVETHLTTIMRKVGVTSRARLAAKYWAIEGGSSQKKA